MVRPFQRPCGAASMPKALLEAPPADSRSRAKALLMGLQDSICAGLEEFDAEGCFAEESWERPEGGGVGAGRPPGASPGHDRLGFEGQGKNTPLCRIYLGQLQDRR